MEWFKKHADTLAVLAIVVGAAIWMNNSVNQLQLEIDKRFNAVEKDLAIIKTVLVMKEIMPKELASNIETK